MTRSGLADPRQALMEAAGDPRDWFRYGHRLRAYERAWAEFMDARRRRRFDTGFTPNPPIDGARTAEGVKGVTSAMMQA